MTVAVAGHFGEWIQGRMGSDGPLALVTVACPVLTMDATYHDGGPFRLTGPGASALPMDRALQCLDRLGQRPQGTLHLDTAMPPGGGAGASTAALVALARVFAPGATAAEIARACLAAEGASDPLMWPAPDRVLWAPRQGQRLADLPPLPRVDILGGFWGPGLRTDAMDELFPDITPLWADWQAAPLTPLRLAGLASASSSATTAVRGPAGDPTADLARDCGALGFLRAHTGSARGLIFAPGTVPPRAHALLVEAGLTAPVQFATGDA